MVEVTLQNADIGAVRDRTYRKVAWRIMPLIMLCYVANYIDRTNIGIAQIHMRTDLGFTDEVYGIGVGLFFVGFILFEVPSNVMLARIGARLTLLRIMVAWGLMTSLTMFVRTPHEFYAARILLGMAEAGFFPGVLLYLTYWFPSARRTRITAFFFLGLPISGIVGSPLSGWIMRTFDDVAGLHSWQWLFVLEGVPAVILGIVAFLWLQDKPAEAKWLTDDERAVIEADLAEERRQKDSAKSGAGSGLLGALKDPRVFVLGLIGCGTYTLANAVSFWSPLLINASGVKEVLDIGLLAGIAPVLGIVVMILVGMHSDKTLERRWHAAACELVGAASLVALSFSIGQPVMTVVLIAIMTAAHYSGLTVFWSIPSVYLSDRVKASGIAISTAMGSFAAATTPMMLGYIRTTTGSLSLGLQISAGIIAIASIVLLVGIPASALREKRL
jgi:D-galactonate transporter